MTSAIIVDDEELAVERLGMLLAESGEIDVRRGFLNPMEAYDYLREHSVDVVFLDIDMPEISGMSLCDRLLELQPEIDVVFVTGYSDYAVQAFELSALDYLTKPVTEQRLAKTLDKIKRNRPRKSADPSRSESQPGSETLTALLTEQEARVIRLMTDGLSNKEIADQLSIAAETVKWHIKNAYRKLNVGNRVQALQRV
ncbi:response regulator, partial [Mycobacterium tuberculosis]